MRDTAAHLLSVLEQCVPMLLVIDPEVASRPTASGKWSCKQILGHLIDSACNNQQKFARLLACDGHVEFVGYAQDDWVAHQHYQERDWPELIALWQSYNRHLAHVIEHADPARLDATITIDGVGPFRLDFVMSDYVEHLKHHLRTVLPDAGLTSEFGYVYGA